MDGNDEKIAQFVTVTGVDDERARFYLESSAFQLEVAIARFYENDGDSDEAIPAPVPVARRDSETDLTSPTPSIPVENPSTRSGRKDTKFATLNTLNNSSDDDEEEGQAFYAGGSEHSGQQVLGPRKTKDIVADMFKSVEEHGVEILDQKAGSSKCRAFRGTGYKLGQNATDSEAVSGTVDPPPPQQVTLKLWRDGFSLNDGDLRAYTDPSNREFLEDVKRGKIPQELRQGNSEVHLIMEDHGVEAFKLDNKKSLKAFSGQGYTLGSPAPPVVGATGEEDNQVNEAHAREALEVNPAEPITNIQIRLADGSRLLGQFNHGHTLGQVRSFIITARPQYQTRAFTLLSTYPSHELEDSQTIVEAGILNSAIMQKLK